MVKNKKILVTGGTGYIGSHTAVSLIESGYQVILADNLSNSDIRVLAGIEKITGVKPEFEKTDFTQKKQVSELFEKHAGIEAVIHFAAFKAVGESVAFPLKYYHNNLLSMLHVLEAMKQFNIPHLVFSSSCTVYGQPDLLPVTEQSPLVTPSSPYGFTKLASERMIQDFDHAETGTAAVILRYFNPIGAHPSALIGEIPTGTPNNLVPFITQTAAGIHPELQIFGNDYHTPDGTAIRDYIHIMDIADAHVVCIDRLINMKNHEKTEIFNLGTGHGLSVLEVVNIFEKVSGQKLPYRFVPRRPGDVEKIWADPSMANSVLGWKTRYSDDEALLSAWKWQLNLKKVLNS